MSKPRSRWPTVLCLVTCLVAGADVAAAAPSETEAARGELLYATHCIACHDTQVHWREQKLVTDWASLKLQVRRWAGNAGLGWTDEEIVDVARYINAAYYRFESTTLTESAKRERPSRTARAD